MPQPRRFPSAAKRELTPPGPACQQLFFQTPKFFFEARPEDFSPAQKRELIPTPSRCQQLFSVFSKNFLPRRARPPGPARLNETLCPAAARTGYAPLRPSCQRLFIFFLIFFDGRTLFLLCFHAGWGTKICCLARPSFQNIRPYLPQAALSTVCGQRKSPPQVRRRAFHVFWNPASY